MHDLVHLQVLFEVRTESILEQPLVGLLERLLAGFLEAHLESH